MPRIRTLKADFFTSPAVASLSSYRCRLTFAGLICCYVDDFGRGKDDPRLIKAAIWPQDDDVTVGDVTEDLCELNMSGLIVRYDEASSGTRGLRRAAVRRPVENVAKYLALPSWKEHQRVSHPTKSKIPPPPAVSRKLPKDSELFATERARGIRSGSGLEEEVGSGTRARRTRAASDDKGDGGVQAHEPKPETTTTTRGGEPEHISDAAAELVGKVERAAKTRRTVAS